MEVNEEVCTGNGTAYQYCVHLRSNDRGCTCANGHEVVYNAGSGSCDDKEKPKTSKES